MIADTEKFGGNSTVEVFNRPSGQDPGPGTSLVE
jgi:hypothetical protein